jgi:autotransporter passenger strand-loop-strand repeat protein/adhesin HecA-like repeat protein
MSTIKIEGISMKLNKRSPLFFLFSLVITQAQLSADTQWTGTSGTIPTDDIYYISTTITLTGNLTVPTGATLEMRTGGSLRISSLTLIISGGIVDVQSGGALNNAYAAEGTGNITVSGGALNISGGDIFNARTANTTGNITVSGGALNISSGNIYNANPDDTIGNITISGGTFNISGGNIYNANAFNATGNITISGGTFNINGGNIYNANGALSFGNITVSSGSFVLGGGNLDVQVSGAGTVKIFGSTISSDITSGTMTNNATMTIPLLSSLVIDNNGTLNNDGTINSSGTLDIESGGTLNNDGTINSSGTLDIESGGALNNAYADGSSGTITISTGTLNIKGGNLYNVRGDFSATGTINVSGGTINLSSGNLFNARGDSSTGIINVFNGATVNISNGTLYNAFTNASDGTINIYGSSTLYTLSGGIIYNTRESADMTGTINIGYGGALYAMDGLIENGSSNAEINIESGGSLYNYHGIIDISAGGSDSLNINNGGKFDNVRGNNPGLFTISAGGNFSDLNEITLDKNLDIDYTWTLTEVAVINGYGNIITLGADGAIVIGKDASLLLNEVVINDVSGNKIRCTDNSSTLSIHNVIWTQDSNFSYTKGKIYVSGDWLIQGKDTEFGYESDQEITVTSDAIMHMLMTTFNFNSDTSTLLNLHDNTSTLHLEHGTLLASKACTLENGTLQITGLGICQGDSTLNLQSLDSIDIVGGFRRVGAVVI